jgi:hypothetical protein
VTLAEILGGERMKFGSELSSDQVLSVNRLPQNVKKNLPAILNSELGGKNGFSGQIA